MKNASLPRKTVASLLAAAMLVGLAGCGKAGASTPAAAPAQSDSTAAQSVAPAETEQPAASEAAAESTQTMPKSMAQKNNADAFPRMSLEELRAQALSENEYATFAGAYLEHESIDGIGTNPTINAVLASYDFIDAIDDAHRIDISGGADDAQVFCLLPIDPNTGATASIIDFDTDEVKEEVYHSETGEPILISCNGGGTLNAKVSFTFSDGWTEDFWPMTDVYNGVEHFVEPNGGTCYDFTVYPQFPNEASSDAPVGKWTADVEQTLNGSQMITLTLTLPTQGEADLMISDTASGDFMVGYRGSWEKVDSEDLSLDLTCYENCTGMTEYDAPVKGNYKFTAGADGSMTVWVLDPVSTPFYVNHPFEPIAFQPQVDDPNAAWAVDDIFSVAVKNYYETTTGYRPTYAEAIPQDDNMVLIRLYDDMGDHISTAGWFLIDPATMQGRNYLTEEPIDFSDFTDGIG